MVKGISPLRLALMFAAALGAASCGKSSGAHFRLTGQARHDWRAAAQQVLEEHCGVSGPPTQQIESTATMLKQFNIEHVASSGGCGIHSTNSETPQSVDHENCGVGSFLGSETEIALPPGVCGVQGGSSADAGTPEAVTPPPTPKPDAGTADAGVPEAVTPPVQPDAGTPEAEAQPIQDIGPEEVTQPEAAGPSPEFQQAKASLRSAISRAGRVYSQLSDNELTGNEYAKKLRREKNEAQAALSEENASLADLQSALSQLNSAIATACTQANNDVRGLGGSISCQ